MIRDRFQYHAPDSLEEVVELLGRAGAEAEVIGGGTWVVTEMVRGLRRPAAVVDLRHAGLAGVSIDDGHVAIGPMTTYSQLERSANAPALLRAMAHGITGGPQIRNQGTVGGSACYANPASDVPAVLTALDARLRLASSRGEREIAAADFFEGAFTTARSADEVVSAITLPRPQPGWRYGYEKFKLVEGSWPIVTAACVADAEGAIRSLVVGGAAAAPIRVDPGPPGEGINELRERVIDAVSEPWSDVLAPGKYRRAISGAIAGRAVRKCRAADQEGGR